MATVSTPVSTLASARAGSARAGSARSGLILWHLLSLDAPAVAAVWCWWIAKASGLKISIAVPIAIALATWVLYVSDRLLDGVCTGIAGKINGPESLRERHLFHLRHWRGFAGGLGAASVCVGALAFNNLDPRIVRAESGLGVFVLLYFVVIHSGARSAARNARGEFFPKWRRWFPKELTVAILFAIATAIPALVLSDIGSSPAIFPTLHVPHTNVLAGALLFAGLCWLNCGAIDVWERRPGEAGPSDQAAPARPELRVAEPRITGAALALAALSCCVVILPSSPAVNKIALAVFLSAVLILTLDRNRMRIAPITLRAAADAVLLTPLLLFPFLR